MFSFLTPQQAPLSVSLWVCVVGKSENSGIHPLLCYFKHVFLYILTFFAFIEFKPWTFTNTINSVLHIILIPNAQRASTLPAASADSLSELISELQRTQYDCSAFMLLWGGNLQVHPGCSVTLSKPFQLQFATKTRWIWDLLCLIAPVCCSPGIMLLVLKCRRDEFCRVLAERSFMQIPALYTQHFPFQVPFKSNYFQAAWDFIKHLWPLEVFWLFASLIQSQLCFVGMNNSVRTSG